MDEGLLPVIQRALNASGLDYSDLEIEITERRMIEHVALTDQILEELASLGVRIAVDDFDTGYSSLAYLARVAPASA